MKIIDEAGQITLDDMGRLEREIRSEEAIRAKEPGKCLGECESCGQETVLVEEIGMCGPCTFGESDTANGNW